MLFSVVQDSVAQTLKQKTEEKHIALEAFLMPQLHALRAPAHYAHLLTAFYGYFKPVEAAIDVYVGEQHLPDIKARRKSKAIADDLIALRQPHAHIAIAQSLPTINNLYNAMGAMYVLEGSTLGGRGITKMLQKNTQLQLQQNQLQFFSGYGAATGAMWTTFLAVLNAMPNTADDLEAMVTGANETFHYFKIWLQKALIHV